MKRKYLVMILLCYFVTGIVILGKTINDKKESNYDMVHIDENESVNITTKELKNENEGQVEQQKQRINKQEQEKTTNKKEQNKYEKVGREYLSDALFIGDSRTVGLMEYGGANEATFFADTGMSVFKLFDTELYVPNIGKVSLDRLLKEKKFGKIYIMLGINEAGYPKNSIKNKYEEVVKRIMEAQPEVKIVLCANLHVTENKNKDRINNRVINSINMLIKKIAKDKGIYFLDINEKFDDSNGNLKMDYSSDDVHVLGKYYQEWIRWICTKGVKE